MVTEGKRQSGFGDSPCTVALLSFSSSTEFQSSGYLATHIMNIFCMIIKYGDRLQLTATYQLVSPTCPTFSTSTKLHSHGYSTTHIMNMVYDSKIWWTIVINRCISVACPTFSTAIKLCSHGYPSIPAPRVNADVASLDPWVEFVSNNAVLVPVPREVLRPNDKISARCH